MAYTRSPRRAKGEQVALPIPVLHPVMTTTITALALLGQERARQPGELRTLLDLEPVAGVLEHLEPGVGQLHSQVLAGRQGHDLVVVAAHHERRLLDLGEVVVGVLRRSPGDGREPGAV